MSYKSILTVQTQSALNSGAMSTAQQLASQYDAHLEAIALGIDRTQTGYNYGDINALFVETGREEAAHDANQIADAANAHLDGTPLRFSVTKAAVAATDAGRLVARYARFNDLAVLDLPYGENADAECPAVVEACLFEASTPTLICPQQEEPMATPKRIVLAWNDSSEALAASRAALPFLKAADVVYVTVIEPPRHGPDRSDPGGALSQMLSRHGVRCEVDVLGKNMPRISDILHRHVADRNADMVIMGAYGHSRFREAVFGGATRHMLETATVPVFMAR